MGLGGECANDFIGALGGALESHYCKDWMEVDALLGAIGMQFLEEICGCFPAAQGVLEAFGGEDFLGVQECRFEFGVFGGHWKGVSGE